MAEAKPTKESDSKKGVIVRFLDFIEWLGNKLPDPAVLFLIGLILTWACSWWLSSYEFTETVPGDNAPIQINNLMTLDHFADFLANMVEEFVGFHPLGVVLVALLGVGVAEHSGFLNAVLKSMLNITPNMLLTPMLILVAIVSHTAADAGYVLVIPIGGVMFYAAGRHPLAGIAAAFAGVSGGFSANFIPSGIDPLLSGLTQEGVAILDADRPVNPLCNYGFTAASSVLIILVGWFLTDKIIEPRLRGTAVDGDPDEMPKMEELSERDKRGMYAGLISIFIGLGLLFVWCLPSDSALKDPYGKLTAYRNSGSNIGFTVAADDQGVTVDSVADGGAGAAAGIAVGDQIIRIGTTDITDKESFDTTAEALGAGAPVIVVKSADGEESSTILTPAAIPGARMMQAIVPLIFFLFIIPGLVHGYVSGKFRNHRDVVKGMSKTMETMGYYLVLVFFAALFIAAFNDSNIGRLLAVKGANFIKESEAPPAVTICGIILLAACVNLLVGSASAKWAMLAPIFVPMLMILGISPEMTQAAYRVGDSTTNIITPMMPYFPLVVVFCQRYVKDTGIGTVAAMMLPFSITFLITWTIFLLIYWQLGLPLGFDAPYEYTMPDSAAAGGG